MLPSRQRFERCSAEVLRASLSDALRMTPPAHRPNSVAEGVVEGGEGGGDGRLGAQDELAERGLAETGVVRGGKLGFGPAAFGADGEGGLPTGWPGAEDFAKGQGVGPFGQQDFYGVGVGAEGLRGLRQLLQNGDADAARLLRSFGENFLPALGALRRCGEVLAPSSVAFSMAHSKASNFTIARSSVRSMVSACAGISSSSANSTRSRATFSIRPSHTRWPSLSS